MVETAYDALTSERVQLLTKLNLVVSVEGTGTLVSEV